MQVHAFRHNGTAEGHGGEGGGARMGCYQNGSEQTSTTGQQQYSKYQYPTMTRAAGATGAADTEEGRRTTWRAVSHWKRLQVTRRHTPKAVMDVEEKQYGPASS